MRNEKGLLNLYGILSNKLLNTYRWRSTDTLLESLMSLVFKAFGFSCASSWRIPNWHTPQERLQHLAVGFACGADASDIYVGSS